MSSATGGPASGHGSNPVAELLALLKGAVTAVLDFAPPLGSDPVAGALVRADNSGDPDRSCVDILRRLLGAGGATELRISALPARVLRVENGVVEDPLAFDQNCCSICLDGYESNNRVRILVCGHCFHTCCIDVWLRKRATCPMCQLVVC